MVFSCFIRVWKVFLVLFISGFHTRAIIKICGALGGSVWSSLIANPAAHEVIATTGNPCLFSQSDEQHDSFVAMDWDTGTTLWQYTALDHDDCDFGEGPVDYVDHGQEYLVAGNKCGFVYALTPLPGRHSVQLAWSLKIAKPCFSGILYSYSFPEMPKHSSS